MPRKNLSKIHDFYEYIDGRSICQVTDIAGNVCEVAVKGRHAGNLEKHVFRNHEAVWNDYYHNFKLPMLAKEESFATPPPKRPKILPEYVKVTDAALDNTNFTYRNLEKACITMATVDGRPLSFVEDIGFRMILDPLLEIMNNTDRKDYVNFSMNKNKLQRLIKEEAEIMKYSINRKISGKLICLKIDCASIFEKHFLSFGVFFKDLDDYCLYTFPLVEVQDISNTDVVKITILESLSLYGIIPAQIYAFIVDSTVNILNPHDILKDENADELFFEEPKNSVGDKYEVEQNADVCKKGICNDASENPANDTEYDTFVIEVDYEGESVTTVANSTSSRFQNSNIEDRSEDLVNKVIECWSDEDINCVVCPAHLFELVIKEALKVANMINFPKKVREIVRKYRTPENLRSLYVHSKRTLIIDHPDKWLSTYDMFQRLLELKPFLKKMTQSKDLFISAAVWKQINDYVTSYAPAKSALYRLQTENVSFSEFFKIWTTCLLKTKKIGTQLADALVQIMDQNQDVFYHNILFLSCVFLDPRFKNILDDKYIPDIVEHLSELYFKILSFKSEEENYEIDFVDMSEYKDEPNLPQNVNNNRSRSPDVNDFIKSMIKLPTVDENSDQSKENIKSLLKTFFESEPLLGPKEDVLKFWNEKKYAYPELYKISQTVFSVSASHYSINKMTSQLKYLYNPYSNISLAVPIVNDILTVRVNSDVAKFK